MRRLYRIALLLLVACCTALPVQAHESRPAYLQLTLTANDSVDLLLKVPAKGDRRFGLYPKLPANCTAVGEPVSALFDNAYTERSRFRCAGGLVGRVVFMDGLASTLTDVLVRVEKADGSVQIGRMTPSDPFFEVEASPSMLGIAATYLAIGIDHILSGIDHLLFVLALLMLVRSMRTLVWTITAFTAAHSLTLAAATLGVIRIQQAPIEAVIALSIVFVAAEIVHARRGKPGLAQQKPWLVAFTFGLLHGLGFAGALVEIGLPEQSVPLALLFFNLGVEVGQLAFIAVVLTVIALGRRMMKATPEWAPTATAYAIGMVACYWVIERVAGFW